MNDQREDRYIPPGIGGYDCYVAFFGPALPSGNPDEKPYMLRYAACSLTVIEPHARGSATNP
jgi:hypothetical protein